MGSKTFDGVWFVSFADDHMPPHVHGRYAGVTLIIDSLADGSVVESSRRKAVSPRNAKRNDVAKILSVAKAYSRELHELWAVMHG